MLLLDVGNSRCKWALVQDGAWVQQGAADNAGWQTLQQPFALLSPPSRILVANVAGETMAGHVRSLCDRWSCTPEFITARGEQCGVRNGYEQPVQLGCDRWAALIAAWHEVRGACLVVNCGTATTVDALSDDGVFLGGLILPGVDLMRRTLSGSTAQLPDMQGRGQDFPRNTADAIHSGVLQATLGAICHQYGLLRARHAGACCVLGGGAADVVQPGLDVLLVRMEQLVLKGLQVIGESKA